MRHLCTLFGILWLLVPNCHSSAQVASIQDTFANEVKILKQLVSVQNFEKAQLESVFFIEFLERQSLPLNAETVSLLSAIYAGNRDKRSAIQMLWQAEANAKQNPNPVTKAILLDTLVKQYQSWGITDRALACQQLLSTTKDSIESGKRKLESLAMQQRIDSLSQIQAKQVEEKATYFQLDRQVAYAIAGFLALLMLVLLFQNYRTNKKWAKLLDKKELEWEIMKANIRQEAEENTAQQILTATQSSAASDGNDAKQNVYYNPKPEQIALLIEPNRQVVLYLKSLLSDRFQVETARTANEGLQMVNELLPDLIVCDALLNGKSGIEIGRQIKLSDKSNHVPLVLLTNKFGNEGKLDALRAGADAWFTRPVIDDEFDASIQRLIDTRKELHHDFNRTLHLYFTDNRIGLKDPFMQKVCSLIEENLANPDFMADEIARKLQLSKAHFTKKINALTGKEPIQLIREMRLEKAKTLLEKRAGTPNAISELVGFSSPGTFALAFKEYFGENTMLLYSIPNNKYI
ncbi:MAG: response regulator transcription factor [Saprospiraceae bacterium]